MPKLLNGFYPPARVQPSPNKSGPITPEVIIIHDTAGRLDKFSSVRWLCDPAARASAHFVIERDGTITQLISTNLKAWHAGKSSLHGRENVNAFSIGIEFVNPGALAPAGDRRARSYFGVEYDRKEYRIESLPQEGPHPAALWMPYTEAQLQAGLELCIALSQAYGIKEVHPHWYISPGRKIDTNPLFPLGWLSARIKGRQDPGSGRLVHPLGPVRRWPSLYDNIIDLSGNFPLEDELTVSLAGDDIPPALVGAPLTWYKFTYNDIPYFVLKHQAELT